LITTDGHDEQLELAKLGGLERINFLRKHPIRRAKKNQREIFKRPTIRSPIVPAAPFSLRAKLAEKPGRINPAFGNRHPDRLGWLEARLMFSDAQNFI